MSRVVIVVPCYNEARRLEVDRYERFLDSNHDVDFLFVNDGSRDGTLTLLQGFAVRRPGRASCLDLETNCGKAEAVRRGMLAALERRPRYVGFWDADLATPLEDIPGFCRVLDARTDVRLVIGSRLPLVGHRIERRRARSLAGHLFALAASTALGVRFRDTQCGAKLLRATPCLAHLFADRFVSRWIFDVEILARLTRYRRDGVSRPLGQLVYEYPLDEWRDVKGSKVLAGDFSKAAMDLAHIYWSYLRPGAGWRPSTHSLPAPPLPGSLPTPAMIHGAHPLEGPTRNAAVDASKPVGHHDAGLTDQDAERQAA
jgi:glycosyltransferase involved in cell wall biosynthesis